MDDDRHIKILLIEDNPGDVRLIREALTEARGTVFDLEWASRLLTGLELLNGGGFDVILLDLSLPDSRGFDSFTKVQTQSSGIPIIVLTGLDDEAVALDAMRGGAQDYLVKRRLDGNLLARAVRYAIERKRAEERIQQQNEFLNIVLESLSSPFYVIDAHDYTVKMANSAAHLGSLPEGVTCYALTHKSNRPCGTMEHPCPVEEVKRTKRPVMVEHIHHDEDGNRRSVEVHAYPIFDGEGDVVQVIEYCLDITERKEEEARKAAERELEKQRVLSMRSDRLRSLGEMAAGIAHELNQPLVGVRGMAERLLIGVDRGWDLSEEKIRDMAGPIVEQADRMEHIIEHIRIFAREAGKPELRPVQVNDVVRAGTDMLDAQFRSRGIQLEYDLADSLPVVSANPFSLEEVVINLLINARDALDEQMNEGSASSPPRVLLRTLLDQVDSERYVKIEVIDDGIGIPEHMIERVFDPFFTTKGPDRGTGLGLSISRSIIEEFCGRMGIQSIPGSGTTVTISLPVA